MEVEQAHGKEVHVLIAEIFGTCFLVFAVNMQAGFSFGVFGIAFTLFGCILMFGGISGGNFNPAVTMGVLVSRPREIGRNIMLFFVSTLAQYVGACIGILLAYLCMWNFALTQAEREASMAILEPKTTVYGAFFSEIICTFLFISQILMVKNPITAPSKEGYLCCWTVGIALLTNICLCGGHTGAALNPAVGLAQCVFTSLQTGNNYYKYIWIYMVGPYLGGVLAGLFHMYHVYTTLAVLGPVAQSSVVE